MSSFAWSYALFLAEVVTLAFAAVALVARLAFAAGAGRWTC